MAKPIHVLNRRKVLVWGGMVGALLLSGGTLVRWLYKIDALPDLEHIHEPLLEQSFENFSAYEATVLHEVAGLIIPADQHPGAKEALVVVEFDQMAKNNERFKVLCQQGVRWLDEIANDLFQVKSFLQLDCSAQTKILLKADVPLKTVWEKISDKIQYGETHLGYTFFQSLKQQTFAVFYAHPMGWMTVGYHGPPQWSGHLDYHICV